MPIRWIKAWLDLGGKDTLRQYYWYDAETGTPTRNGEGLRFFIAVRAWMGERERGPGAAEGSGKQGPCMYACVRVRAGKDDIDHTSSKRS
jgi:hypothetical protein